MGSEDRDLIFLIHIGLTSQQEPHYFQVPAMHSLFQYPAMHSQHEGRISILRGRQWKQYR
jgi:hypothetical protein